MFVFFNDFPLSSSANLTIEREQDNGTHSQRQNQQQHFFEDVILS